MKNGRLLVGSALIAGLGAGLLAQQPAAPNPAAAPGGAPAARPAAPAVQHPDISGIWNRVDTVGGGSWAGLALTFPIAQLQPEYAAKLPPQQFAGVGAVPAGFVPQPYDITAQGAEIPRCAAPGPGGGGRGGGGSASAPINVDSLGISIMVDKNSVVFIRDGSQGVGRRVYIDGRKFADPSRVPGQQSYGYWDGDVLTIKTKGFTSGMVGTGRGWTEPSTELTETFKLQNGGKRLIWTYTYDDPKVYIKPHSYDMVFDLLPSEQYIFESWCDSKEWFADQAKQAAAGRATGAGAGGAAPAAAGQGRGGAPAAPAGGR